MGKLWANFPVGKGLKKACFSVVSAWLYVSLPDNMLYKVSPLAREIGKEGQRLSKMLFHLQEKFLCKFEVHSDVPQ